MHSLHVFCHICWTILHRKFGQALVMVSNIPLTLLLLIPGNVSIIHVKGEKSSIVEIHHVTAWKFFFFLKKKIVTSKCINKINVDLKKCWYNHMFYLMYFSIAFFKYIDSFLNSNNCTLFVGLVHLFLMYNTIIIILR